MDTSYPSGGQARALESAVLRLRTRLMGELEKTETEEDFLTASSEYRMKVLSGIFKALQGVEDMINRIKRDSDSDAQRGIDVVEFRRQLEEQIARLVEKEAEATVSGGVE